MNSGLGRFLKHMIVMMLGSAAVGTLLLVLVFCLPGERMTEHVAADVGEMIRDREQIPDSGIENYIWMKKETYTDTIMIQNAIEKVDGKNAFEHAMWAYHYDVSEEVWEPEESLRMICRGEDVSEMNLHTYARYWHGYLVYLKPLLLFLSWKQIIILGILIQFVLMAAVVWAAVRRKRPEIALALAGGLLFMKPLLVLISLTMSVCWIITLTVLLLMLIWHERLESRKWYPELFLAAGIITAYFDFLTYPVVTLGFPLCTCFLLKKGKLLKEKLVQLIGYCICWGTGYGGMWAMKWVIADLTLHTGTIRDAAWSIIGRTESIGGRPRFNGGFYVIGLNMDEYDMFIYVICAAAAAAAVLAVVLTAGRRAGFKYVLGQMVPFAVIFCIPFVWIILVQHHSALHARFTFRILSVAVLAVSCIGAKGFRICMAERQKTDKEL